MRIPTIATAASIAATLLAGCSGGPQGSNPTMLISNGSLTRSYSDLARTGVAPEYFAALRLGLHPNAPHKHKRYKGLKDLYVSDFGTGAVEILKNKSYSETGTITDGIYGPDGSFIDKKGNFYVADFDGVNINEYAPGAASPTFTYNYLMKDPVDVAVDSAGNVYEADNSGSEVNEYAQGSNTLMNSCKPGGPTEGVAVDRQGDVFVLYQYGVGKLVEYKGGLSGCSATPLSATVTYAGGMAIDKNDNLVVCDQTGDAVDVIDPPYTSISRTLQSGYSPFHVSLDKDNKYAFVASVYTADVYVVDYATGTTVTTLGYQNGISDPSAAVDGPNAVY